MPGGRDSKIRNTRKRQKLEGKNSRSMERLTKIYLRDRGICQLCFKPCSREDASRDHIIELRFCDERLARDISNQRLAHKDCNNKRSNPLAVAEDLLLVEEAFPDFPVRSKKKKHLEQKLGELFPDLRAGLNWLS